MLLVADVKKERRNEIPENYNELPLLERLYFLRSDIPAVTHIDGSGRLQTIKREQSKVNELDKWQKKDINEMTPDELLEKGYNFRISSIHA